MTRFSTIISFLSILAIGAFIAIATRGRLGYRKQSPEVVLMGSVESVQRCRV
jgi:hypothetical protein